MSFETEERMEKKIAERAGLYKRSNPPPSISAGLERLARVEMIIERVRAQLEYTITADFQADEGYDKWKTSAQASLGAFVSEQQFLIGWLGGFNETGFQGQRQYRKARADLATHVYVYLQEVQGVYSPIYTLSILPENVELAQRRYDALYRLRERCVVMFQDLRVIGARLGIGDKGCKKVWGPLTLLFATMSDELGVVGRYLKQHTTPPAEGDSAVFLLNLIARIDRSALMLTPEEAQRLHIITNTFK